ncbi:MAG: YifB family Mg chelatase-like AAA ATPase [Xanthomonadales bacterium]|nr:YifB family Mg chelatase-like AAA ATPase [Xanthomonadales bacterium]
MGFAWTRCRAEAGVLAPPVRVETHLGSGLPTLNIVGLPETAVKESKDRVRGALQNAGFEFPLQRIIVNLSPADLPKEGGRYDLAIALGILGASGQIPRQRLPEFEFMGELGLNGDLRPCRGILPAALAAREARRTLVVPRRCGAEAALLGDHSTQVAGHLLQITAWLQGQGMLDEPAAASLPVPDYPELADVRGQVQARRALEVAAAGGHNLLMCGPPGAGKTMLALRLPGILPPMTEAEALEAAAVMSISNSGFRPQHWRRRSFRSPHHTASGVALVGGGSSPRPGEISLAHRGVLFLDELPEFDRRVLEVLREPLESGRITISRAARQAEFPARFQLVAAMNPCPCGYRGSRIRHCRCSPPQVDRYRSRISGPLLDRVDLQIWLSPLTPAEIQDASSGESSEEVRRRAQRARQIQVQRQGCANAQLDSRGMKQHCALGKRESRMLHQAIEKLKLSARGCDRIRRVARTIADLAEARQIGMLHLGEAIQYRQLDRGQGEGSLG